MTLAADFKGRVVGPTGDPIGDAVVSIVELRRTVVTDSDGAFSFTDVPAGDYHIKAERNGLGTAVAEVTTGDSGSVELRLDRSIHREKIVVSADRIGTGTREVVQAATVLERDDVIATMQPTLGEMLIDEPGVTSTAFGQGAGRPIIRGQQGARIRVLEDGLDVGDVSVTSPDHAVTIDPFEADTIEIIRGPSVLLYGSTATGGIVNVIDNKIPKSVPTNSFGGELNLRYGSAAEEEAGGLRLHGGANQFAWQVSGFSRESEDYEIPGAAILGEPAEGDTLANSAFESDGFNAGLSWIGDNGFVGIGIKQFNSVYGVPAELEEEEDEAIAFLGTEPIEEEGGVTLDMEQVRYDVEGGWNSSDTSSTIDGFRFDLGVTDYEHVELEGTEVGTRFDNESWEARGELLMGQGAWSGVVGVQAGNREFEAIGAEAFVPPSETDNLALFTLQRFDQGDVRWEAGLRFEQQDNSAIGEIDRDFDGVSGSVGVAWEFAENFQFGTSLARSTRFPTAEELYSDGPHVATLAFEVGDPNLVKETSVGLDLSVRKTAGRFTGFINFFVTDFDDYIFEAPTGAIEDGLPVFQFGQTKAEFYGYEASGTIELIGGDRNHLDLTITTDSTRAEDTTADQNLPLIPPRTHSARFDYRTGPWSAMLAVRDVEAQERTAGFETTTEGYTFVDASVGYTFGARGNLRAIHQIMIRGRNLGDEEARIHTSRLKDLILQPGRDVSASYRVVF